MQQRCSRCGAVSKELGGEYRNYYFNNVSSGHTLAQRLEYWKTAYWIITQHPITGVGTGDVPTAFQEAYESRNSSLTKEWRLRAHNQYLSLGVAFGWPGMLLFIVVLLYTFKISFQRRDVVYFAFLLIALRILLKRGYTGNTGGSNVLCLFEWDVFCLGKNESFTKWN
ncbi:MAG: O-antigen ligase family protein [Bacteroidetes bacterium]|nr:O-antigen ligase family protein [Bacteroidota bacterium]